MSKTAGKTTSKAFSSGALRHEVPRWKDSPNLDDTKIEPTFLAIMLGRFCLVLGAFCFGCGISDLLYDRTPLMLLVFPGAFLIVLYIALTTAHTRAAHMLQDILRARKDNKRETARFHIEDKMVADELEWCHGVFSNITTKTGTWKEPEERSIFVRGQAVKAIQVFSLGAIEPDPDVFFPEHDDIATTEAFAAWKTQVEAEHKRAEDIARIWESVISPAKLDYASWEYTDSDKVGHLGRRLGIDAMIDAYLSGVPVDMVVAGFSGSEESAR